MIFNIFKKEKEIKKSEKAEEKKEVKKPEKKPEKKGPINKGSAREKKKTLEEGITEPSKKKKHYNLSLTILESPHITEKATRLERENKYIFKVEKRANKKEVKKVIEELYGVNVVSVRIVNIPRKKRRLGRVEGFRKGYKKAIVKIREGQKINILSK